MIDVISDGARFEDDGALRPLNHFYDPLTNRPLTVPVFTTQTSPDWALEDRGNFEEQAFSFRDTRNSFYDALTLTTKEERERNFGLTFQGLGQVIHHVQDMAQPQHVRLDEHCDSFFCRLAGRFNPSRYEAYTNERLGTLIYSGYPPVVQTQARNFWHTDDGKGIADYTNRGFVSAGTNPSSDFPEPTFSGIAVVDVRALFPTANPPVPVPAVCQDDSDPCFMSFLHNEVMDSYNSTFNRVNERATTVSIFDEDLRIHAPAVQVFSLNRFNYDTAHGFLIKRAVAYSAGLIDYFFRGRLAAVDPEFTDTGVRLKVKNAIDAEETPEWAKESLYAKDRQGKAGRFVLTVTYKQGEQERLIASDPVSLTVDEFIKPGETSTQIVDFSLSPPPADATDIEYRLVFRGRLGEEDDAVAVGLIAPASGFIVRPNYLPDDGISGNRLMVRSGGRWRLTEESNLQGGNIDWKGAYVNGRPTKVLSWSGPKSRHFPDSSGNPFSSSIYQDGERFARLPAVLGAAITKDAAGKEWLVAVSRGGNADIVYRRPNEKSNSFALFDPVTNPTGWQVIGRFPWEADFKPPNRPWFFNGKGNKAQTMRPVEDLDPNKPVWQRDPNKLDRLLIEIDIDSASATLTNLGNLGGITDTKAIESVLEGRKPAGLCDTRPIPNASGHEHSEVRITRDFEGEYIVAVDYKDDTEVLGKIVAEGHDTYTAVADKDWACKPVPFTLTHDTYVETFNHSGTESTDLIIGNSGKSVNIESLSHSGSGTLTHFPHIHEDTAGNSTSTLSGRTSFELLYLDLRNDLYAAHYRDQASTGTGVVTGKQVCADRRSHSTKTLRISYTNEIVIDERTDNFANSSCNAGANFLPGRTPPFADFPFGTKTFYPTVRIGTAPGSWAVSANGDLFVSQEYRDRNFERQYFNFLTNGDPEALIRTAPENAWYFPVYVIK